MKKKLHKAWQTFLVISVPVSIISIIFWGCCLDSDSIVPTILLVANLAWVLLLFMANDPSRVKQRRERKNETDDKQDTLTEL